MVGTSTKQLFYRKPAIKVTKPYLYIIQLLVILSLDDIDNLSP